MDPQDDEFRVRISQFATNFLSFHLQISIHLILGEEPPLILIQTLKFIHRCSKEKQQLIQQVILV